MPQFISSSIYTLIALQTTCFTLPASLPDRRDICFWPSPNDGTLNCEHVFEDKQINGIEYGVFRYPEVPADSQYIGYVSTVLDEISPLYTSFSSGTSLAVSIHMVDLFDANADSTGEEVFAETIMPQPVQHCYIRIAATARAGPRSESQFKRTLTHEMYHCIQQRVGTFLPDTGVVSAYRHAKWWVEGSANFMANQFYPHISEDDSYANSYVPTLSITEDSNAYPAWVILQHLSNSGWSVEQVNAWVLKQQRSFSLEAELSRIAADADLVTAWPHFATAFIDTSIKWKDGTAISPLMTVPAKVIMIPEAPTYEQEITLRFFQIQRWTTTLPVDKTVTMTFTPDAFLSEERTVLQYRRGKSGPWRIAPVGRQITLQNGCQVANDPWEFIVTSTNDPASTPPGRSPHAKLSFTISTPSLKRQEGESCEQPPNQPQVLDTCLIGSWTMNHASMQQFLTGQLADNQAGTVSNFLVTGSSSLNIDDDFHSLMKFDPIIIFYDVAADGALNFHTDIIVQGTVDGHIIKGARSSSFTWALGYTTSGSVHTATQIPSLGVDLPSAFPMDQQYNTDTQVQYTCSGNSLQMTGYWNGGYVWAYTWIRV